MKVKRALISVSDKTGLGDFVKRLHGLGVEIISTGGTSREISSMGVPVREVASYTGFPEMLDGRVKTLHPKIHAGLLALRENPGHMRQLEEAGILPIDMVVVNLYPFEETTAREGVSFEDAIENIDIGGPAMLRSAAKNFNSVAVISSPSQYGPVLAELEANKCVLKGSTLKGLAAEVFLRVSMYDSLIAGYLAGNTASPAPETAEEEFPPVINIELKKVRDIRYGENPHQRASYYRNVSGRPLCVADAKQLQGKELSFNNIIDLGAAVDIVKGLKSPAVGIIKHNNPCGAAAAETIEKAYVDAIECDRLSAFGCIMGFNRPIDASLAGLILKEADFVECIIAPAYGDGAFEIFKAKKNLRVLEFPFFCTGPGGVKDVKMIPGGALVQDKDEKRISARDLKVVTRNKPSEEMIGSMLFGWDIVRQVKSNAIVLCRGTKTVGIGAGQMSRVDAVIIAIRKAGGRAEGSVLVSDAFFPKADSVEKAHEAGIAAIIQPGGSIKDGEVIDACDRFDIPMVFTGMRHFKH